ncbi:hypothetical protein [Actinoplanes solisilvae]|uniref:hypothetical protein n=1 Tax=Actinoplanes solisilvae TaxID=2486853 RepID=UPI000FD6F5AB|nr:hypothetical protein [Actinoplanes solisilvae]
MLVNAAVALALTALPVALAPTDPAPTNVELAWVSDEHKAFAVTWDETGDVRNRIDLVNADGSPTNWAEQYTAAGAPNRATFVNAAFSNSNLRVRVTVVDADGTALSEPADSAAFDTNGAPPPVITKAVATVDGSIKLTWVPGKITDPNPGDPLDLPATEFGHLPFASQPTFNEFDIVGDEVRGGGTVVIKRVGPVIVGLWAVNEWANRIGDYAVFNGTKVTAKVPAKATIGGKLKVTGTAVALLRGCDPGPCWSYEEPWAGREVSLQTRATEDAAWKTVATTKSGAEGKFTFSTAFAATGDYRVIAAPVAAVKKEPGWTYAETTATTVTGVTGTVPDDGSDEGDGGTGGGLPITGPSTMVFALAGVLLVLLGGGLAATGRLRRR